MLGPNTYQFLSEAKKGQKLDFAYLTKVRGHFVDFGLAPDTVDGILLVLVSVVVLVILGLLFNKIRSILHPPPPPTGIIHNPVQIRKIFTTALDQRSKIEMNLSKGESHHVVPCSLLQVQRDKLTLESVRTDFGEQWISREVTCYFRVMGSKKNPVHYSFETTIKGLNRTGTDSVEIFLERPPKLEIQQKRFFLRLEPPSEYVLAFALWPEKLNKDGVFMENVKGWGKPGLYRTPKADGGVTLDNLSAGGMRIFVARSALKDMGGIEFEKARRLFGLLELYDPAKAQKLRFFLHLRIQSAFDDGKNLEVGLKYLSWGRPRQEPRGHVEWVTVSDDGLDSLGNWIQKRHLELFREKGVV